MNKTLRKIMPWIPVIGFPLTIYYQGKYGDTGIDNEFIKWSTAIIQAVSFTFLVMNLIL